MEISRLFMSLLTELAGWETNFCYKHVAPNGAPVLQRRLLNSATRLLVAFNKHESGRMPLLLIYSMRTDAEIILPARPIFFQTISAF